MALDPSSRKVVDAPEDGDCLDLVAADPAGPGTAMPPDGSTTGIVPAHEMPFFGRGKRPGRDDPVLGRIGACGSEYRQDAPGTLQP